MTLWTLPPFTAAEVAVLEAHGVDPVRLASHEAAGLAAIGPDAEAELLARVDSEGGWFRAIGGEDGRVWIEWGPVRLVDVAIENVRRQPERPRIPFA